LRWEFTTVERALACIAREQFTRGRAVNVDTGEVVEAPSDNA